ncbi:MAG TPA: ABC transporter permease [Polyangiaceae bacterium]|nr:ABC transporter permease [Polyangiaceae bacterium]
MKQLLRRAWVGPLAALLAVYALFCALAPATFIGAVNLATMLRQTAVVAVTSLGMTFVILLGGIDLSVGSAVALTGVVVARALQSGAGALSAVAIGVLAAALAGALNGALTAHAKITPFIVTLGSMSVLRGIAKGLAGEQKIDAEPRGLETLMTGGANALMPSGVWLALALARDGAVVLHYTVFGRHVIAIGSNVQTARLCGVPVERVVLAVYALAGALTGVAGVLEFSTLTVGDPTDSLGLELDAIAAVVIGGGSLAGGQGSIAGAMLGALLMTVIKTGSTHVGLPNWVQEILTGVIIVVAVGIDRFRRR